MSEDWEKFWAVYPRKVAKGDARKAWAQHCKHIRPPIADIRGCNPGAIAIRTVAERLRHFHTISRQPGCVSERWDDATTIDLPAPERKKDRFDLANEEQARRDAEWAARAAVRKAAA
jgi:hypothetical protein